MSAPNIRVLNRGSKRGEIWLYDQVGEGFFGGMSAKQFTQELGKLGQVDTINLHINSPGGDVFQGFAIYNALKSHPARVEVDIDGLAASIASVIAMAGDEVRIAANAMVMIHNASGAAFGGAGEMRKTADLLDQVGKNIISTYAKRTGQSDAKLAKWMDEETWMTAAEAADLGFVDVITDDQQIAACFDLSRFHNAPQALAAGGFAAQRPRSDQAKVKLAAMGCK
jgi:ATP-dependent Clp protease protease subunit